MEISNLPPMLAKTVGERGYTELTPVQAAVLQPDALGRDLIVSAQTGSGKTVAFGLAMADIMLGEDGRVPPAGPALALVIAPTRELAMQVSRELSWLYAAAGAQITTCVGGMDASKERRNLARGVHIVVGTPGRLRDHFERGALRLADLKVAVLDEADEMLDMGFREELEAILDGTPDGRRTLLFSATLPRTIVNLAKRYQQNALRISTVGDDRGHGDIVYQAVTVSPSEIENAAVNLLRYHEAETAILFCATREKVRHLHATLQERGFAVVALSGEHTQAERNQAMQALRDRRARVCVATDVAARGIDLPSVTLVVHVEIPRDAEVLQHRSGRTGRAGKKGTAAILVPYPRRRRVESMLRGAKIEAEWIDPPTAEMIRKNDRERLLVGLLEVSEFDKEDRELAERLMKERTPEDIAAALVHAHRAKMPQPEELVANTPEARQAAQKDRHRPGFEDVVWFRMDIGRNQNAEARWLLPLLCRRGHITRNEIGAIRIGPDETFAQVPRAIAGKFGDALKRTGEAEVEAGEESIAIEESATGPRQVSRQNRRDGGFGGHSGKPQRGKFKGKSNEGGNPRPHRKGPHKGKSSDGAKPWEKDGAKPWSKDGAKPQSRDGAKPWSKDGAKPHSKPGAKHWEKNDAKPWDKDKPKNNKPYNDKGKPKDPFNNS